ncbi:MAG: acyltransferase family protein [Oscillospiraceae bacterium]|nr:acyltransferase family protein [Oscillospiraceae bacterium]
MEQKITKPARSSNIELLRILAILGVIVLHYNNSSIGGGFAVAPVGSGTRHIMIFLECIFICAVNVFVMITGYFMSTTNKRTLYKPIRLVAEVVVLNVAMHLANCAINKTFSLKNLVLAAIPENYFVILFCVLYIFSPYINLLLSALNDKQAKVLVLLLLAVFSLYQTAVSEIGAEIGRTLFGMSPVSSQGGQGGYTIVNFALMYILGACVRRFNIELSFKKLTALIFATIGLMLLWVFVNNRRGLGLGENVWVYNNPLVIALASEVFLLFKGIKMGNIKIINFFAKASFTVFLTHTFFFKFINIKAHAAASPAIMLSHLAASAILIYAAGVIIYAVYENSVGRLLGFLERKLPIKDIWKIS